MEHTHNKLSPYNPNDCKEYVSNPKKRIPIRSNWAYLDTWVGGRTIWGSIFTAHHPFQHIHYIITPLDKYHIYFTPVIRLIVLQ